MMNKKLLFEFYIFDKLLKKSMSTINAAEAHGILLAFICINNKEKYDLQEVMLNTLDIQQNTKIISNFINLLYQYSLEQIKTPEKLLIIMLPNKEETLSIKIKYLKLWIKGFISGLGLMGLNKKDYNISIIYEILNDFSMITYLNDAIKEDEEFYYLDLIEYVKISVEIIYFEIYKLKSFE